MFVIFEDHFKKTDNARINIDNIMWYKKKNNGEMYYVDVCFRKGTGNKEIENLYFTTKSKRDDFLKHLDEIVGIKHVGNKQLTL